MKYNFNLRVFSENLPYLAPKQRTDLWSWRRTLAGCVGHLLAAAGVVVGAARLWDGEPEGTEWG